MTIGEIVLKIKPKTNTKGNFALIDIVLIGLFSAVMTVCSLIQIPIGSFVFTLQTMGVFITASLLGWKKGTISVIVYVLLGIIGLPVFSSFSGGIGVLLGPTGGYIIGFIFTSLIVGFMTEKLAKKLFCQIVAMTVGLVVCYIFGTAWFMLQMKTGVAEAFFMCVFPYLIPDAFKIAFSAVLVNRIGKVIKL